MSHVKAIAVIPARGGSKRIPRKNVRHFMGKPMIAHTIEAAIDSTIFERVIVSTDDEEIADVARSSGAEVPFQRPDRLADDHTPISEATAHALEEVDPGGTTYTHVAQLMANCPLRTSEDIRESFYHFQDHDHATQLSVFEFGWQNPWWAFEMSDDKQISPLFEQMVDEEVRSQDQPTLYCITGAIWWGETDVVRDKRTFHTGDRSGWVMPWKRAVDIDTDEDWTFAEVIAARMGRAA